jgi:hypothetical protein
MPTMETIAEALKTLGYKYAQQALEDGTEQYTITVDESEQLEVTGFLYHTDDGSYFRLMGYVDELSEDGTVPQLSLLLALNGDIPTGAFCMDPEEHVIYVTVNLPAAELTADLLGYMIDFLFWAQDLYYEEFYPENGNGNGFAEG